MKQWKKVDSIALALEAAGMVDIEINGDLSVKPSTAKAKGAKTESLAVDWLRANGAPYAERRHLSGSEDQGDIGGIPGVCIEVKSGAKLSPLKWLRELVVEVRNSKASTGAVMVRPKGKPDPNHWYVMMTMEQWRELMCDAGWFGRSMREISADVKDENGT